MERRGLWNFLTRRRTKTQGDEIQLDIGSIPKHIAIIMDGNGRWARSRNLPRALGHRAGVEAIREVVKECNRLGVKYLTLYAFSTENWRRPSEEVNTLMKLLVDYLKKEVNELHENGVIINFIGDISKLPTVCQQELLAAKQKTRNNKGITMNLALNYGGREEIVHALQRIHEDIKHGRITDDKITEEYVSRYLYTANMPDPDLIIRPSGELRLSNFMLWQCAYSEFWYSNVYWPDFSKSHLHQAILEYQKRDRRFGGIK